MLPRSSVLPGWPPDRCTRLPTSEVTDRPKRITIPDPGPGCFGLKRSVTCCAALNGFAPMGSLKAFEGLGPAQSAVFLVSGYILGNTLPSPRTSTSPYLGNHFIWLSLSAGANSQNFRVPIQKTRKLIKKIPVRITSSDNQFFGRRHDGCATTSRFVVLPTDG